MGSLRNEPDRDDKEEEEEVEPILAAQTQRFCMFPIRYQQLWEMYKKAEASFWTGTCLFYSLWKKVFKLSCQFWCFSCFCMWVLMWVCDCLFEFDW